MGNIVSNAIRLLEGLGYCVVEPTRRSLTEGVSHIRVQPVHEGRIVRWFLNGLELMPMDYQEGWRFGDELRRIATYDA